MTVRTILAAAISAAALLAAPGCTLMPGPATADVYSDDAAITIAIRNHFVDDRDVNASSVSVETLDGTVTLSGFATSAAERATIGRIARSVNGVKAVRNEIAIRP